MSVPAKKMKHVSAPFRVTAHRPHVAFQGTDHEIPIKDDVDLELTFPADAHPNSRLTVALFPFKRVDAEASFPIGRIVKLTLEPLTVETKDLHGVEYEQDGGS